MPIRNYILLTTFYHSVLVNPLFGWWVHAFYNKRDLGHEGSYFHNIKIILQTRELDYPELAESPLNEHLV